MRAASGSGEIWRTTAICLLLSLLHSGCSSRVGSPAGTESSLQTEAGPTLLSSDPAQMALLESLGGSAGPGGKLNAISSTEDLLGGTDCIRTSGQLIRFNQPEPGALTLAVDGSTGDQTALAVYRIDPHSLSMAGLPRRFRLIPVPSGDEEPAPLPDYYVGTPDYSSLRWVWRGPFNTDQIIPLTWEDRHDRFYDRWGQTLVAIALHAKPGEASTLAIRGLLSDRGGPLYPSRPFLPRLDQALAQSQLYPAWDNPARAVNSISYQPLGFEPFSRLGASGIEVFRRPAGDSSTAFEWNGSIAEFGSNGSSFTFVDPTWEGGFENLPQPGEAYEYCLRLSNEVGSTVLSNSVEIQTLLNEPKWLSAGLHVGLIRLEWRGQLGILGYELYRDGELLASLPAETAGYSDFDTVPGEWHEYMLRHIYAGGQMDSEPLSKYADADAPLITLQQPDVGSIHFEWNASGWQEFEVHRDGVVLASLAPDTTEFTDSTVATGRTYSYFIRGVFSAGFKDSQTINSAGLSWPAYRIETVGTPRQGRLANVDGFPVLHYNSSPAPPATLFTAEASSFPPTEASAWQQVQRTIQGHENILALTYPSYSLTVSNEQPFFIADGGLSSDWSSGKVYCVYRQPQQMPALPLNMLQWRQVALPTQSMIDWAFVGSLNNRALVVWRDASTLKLHMARAMISDPQLPANWSITDITSIAAHRGVVAAIGALPAALVLDTAGLAYYRGTTSAPAGPQDWQRIQLEGFGDSLALTSIGGLPSMLYVRGDGLWFAQASSAAPQSAAEFSKLQLVGPGELPTITNTRLLDFAGQPLVLYRDSAGRSWIARAVSANPLALENWEYHLLDSQTSHGDLLEINGQLMSAHYVEGERREQGWYITLPSFN